MWHRSLTLENFHDLERVQKMHQNSTRRLSTLFDRCSELCLKFAKACVKNIQTKDLFPLNPVTQSYNLGTRFRGKYKVIAARTNRLKNLSISYMQRLLPWLTSCLPSKKEQLYGIRIVKIEILFITPLSLSLHSLFNFLSLYGSLPILQSSNVLT